MAGDILESGPGTLMVKADLFKAYRQLRVCPGDWAFLIICWRGKYYIDISIPFGSKKGGDACQQVTEAVTDYIWARHAFLIRPYVDDMALAVGRCVAKAESRYQTLHTCLDRWGLRVNLKKCQGPTRRLKWVGVIFDSEEMLMFIPAEKINSALALCRDAQQMFPNPKGVGEFVGKIASC